MRDFGSVGRILLVAGAAFCAASCNSEAGKDSGSSGGARTAVPAAPSPKFSVIHDTIFQSRCLQCHDSTRMQDGIDLSSYATLMAAAETHGDDVVTPGNPDQSHLYEAVSSGTMPPEGPKLTADELRLIHDWIAQGAQDD